MKREPKKTEFLEVRLPWDTKRAFMAQCRDKGISASRLIRDWIDSSLHPSSRAPIEDGKELSMTFIRRSPHAVAVAGSLALLGAGLVAVLFAVPARAAPDPRLLAVFDWTDGDNDGRISQAEFFGDEHPAEPPARKTEPDALTLTVDSRVPPRSGETRQALFARLDSNADGSLSSDEFVSGCIAHTLATPGIARADANHDGALTEGELASYATSQRAEAGDRNAIAAGSMLARGVILEHDKDGDGTVRVADLLSD